MGLGLRMFRKGKLKLLPSFRGVWRFRRIASRLKKAEREGGGRS
jgi:hypothetical protein